MTTKRRFIKHLPLVLAGLALGLGVFINANTKRNENSFVPVDAADYYSGVTDSMTGTTLLNELNTIINTSNVSVDYDWSRYKAADEDPNNSSNVLTVYSRRSMSKSATDNGTNGDYWNREHTFPNSKITGKAESDNHIIYASEKKVNGTRSSLKMGVVDSGTTVVDNNGNNTTCKKTSTLFDPHNVARGIVARTTMYGAAMYGLSPTDNFESVATMLRWHLEYQPTANDIRRNNTVYNNQHNRNPFVDHPEYACRIWGSTNSTTQSICSSVGSVSISSSTESVAAGEDVSISATSSNNSTISWSSDNTAVATVSSATASSGSAITIHGVAAGTAEITASATINNQTYSETCTVTVTAGGGSGGGDSNSFELYSSDLTEGDYIINYSSYAMKNTVSSNRLSYEEVTPSNDAISTTDSSIIWHIAQSGNYWTIYNESVNKFAASTGANNKAQLLADGTDDKCKWTVERNGSTYEFTNKYNAAQSNINSLLRNNTTYGFACYGSGTGGALSLYKRGEGSTGEVTLSSISISTPPTKTTYNTGEYFSPTGLVISRNYSDGTYDTYAYAGHTSEFTFSPSTSTALKRTDDSVTITYSGKTCAVHITVNPPAVTSITAEVSKSYYVGETISASDITVTDSNGDDVEDFTFANDGYRFTYADAASGGALTNKTFANAVAGSNKTCSLTVKVQRKEYISTSTASWIKVTNVSNLAVNDVIIIADSEHDLALGTTQNTNNRSAVSITKSSNTISWTSGNEPQQLTLKSTSGISGAPSGSFGLYTGSGYLYGAHATSNYLRTQSTNDKNGAFVISIANGVTTVSATGSSNRATIRSNYGNNPAIFSCYASDATTGSSVDVYKKIQMSGETPVNLSNYIMFEDENNQCNSKLNIALGYFQNLSSADKNTFKTSNDYVISTARTRLEAWAASKGKTIDYSNGSLSPVNELVSFASHETNNTIIVLVLLSLVGLTAIGARGYIQIKRNKE